MKRSRSSFMSNFLLKVGKDLQPTLKITKSLIDSICTFQASVNISHMHNLIILVFTCSDLSSCSLYLSKMFSFLRRAHLCWQSNS